MRQLEHLKEVIAVADDINISTQKLLIGVLSGTIQLVVRHINDCRRQQNHVILPRLGNFVQYMSSGGLQIECTFLK